MDVLFTLDKLNFSDNNVLGVISASFLKLLRENRQIMTPHSLGVNYLFVTYSGKNTKLLSGQEEPQYLVLALKSLGP